MSESSEKEYPEKYWHCAIKMTGSKTHAIANDLFFVQLQSQVIEPWFQSRPFTVAGVIVRSSDLVEEIKITHTPQSQSTYAEYHNAEMRSRGIADMATNRKMIPLWKGDDYTFELLFDKRIEPVCGEDVVLIERLCKRISNAARILSNRQRKGKEPYVIEDEYDVQDLICALLRAYLKYSVQEDPLQKVAGTRASRADISIEELGVLIEVKYVRSPDDQKKIFDEFSQDLVLYSTWQHLETLLFVIYNSSDLRDPEALEKLSGIKELGGRRFNTIVVLA